MKVKHLKLNFKILKFSENVDGGPGIAAETPAAAGSARESA